MKRSAQVALLLMGVGGVGAGAYAITPPRNDCVPQGGTPPSAMAPNPAGAAVAAAQPCPPRRSGSGSSSSRYSSWSRGSSTSSHWSTPIFNRSGASTVPAAGRSGSAGSSSSSGVARGGFGATGHAASAGG